MFFNPTFNDVLFSHRQLVVEKNFQKLLGELEVEYRESDPSFSLVALRAYTLFQGLNGLAIFTINDKIDIVLQRRLLTIGTLALKIGKDQKSLVE